MQHNKTSSRIPHYIHFPIELPRTPGGSCDERIERAAFEALDPLIQKALLATSVSGFKQAIEWIVACKLNLTAKVVDLLGKQAFNLHMIGNPSLRSLLWSQYGVPFLDLNLTAQELLDVFTHIGIPPYSLDVVKYAVWGGGNPALQEKLVTRETLSQFIYKLLQNRFENVNALLERLGSFGFTEEERIALARKCASKWMSSIQTAAFFRTFEIRDESVRFELARTYAKPSSNEYGWWAPVKEVDQFDITDEQSLEKLAFVYVESAPCLFPKHVAKFRIRQPEVRLQLANLCVEKAADSLAQYFPLFNITKEEDRFEIAKACAAIEPQRTAEFCSNFALTTLDHQLEIARICVDKDKANAAQYLGRFELLSEKMREQLMRQALMTNHFPIKFFKGVAECRFTDPHLIKEIVLAPLRAEKSELASSTVRDISALTITDADVRYELIQELAKHSPERVAENIQHFTLTPAQKIEIATLCAQKGFVFLQHLHRFAFQDPEVLNRLLEKVSLLDSNADTYAYDWKQAFANCAGASPAVRFKLVLQAAYNYNGSKEIPKILKELDFLDRQQQLQVLKACSNTTLDPLAVAEAVDSICTSPDEKLAFIQIIAEPIYRLQLLTKHQYPANELWLSLVEECAAKTPDLFFQYLPQLKIEDRTSRCRLAKVCAQSNGVLTAKNYRLFNLGEDEALHLQLAMHAVHSRGGHAIAPHFNNFGLKKVENRRTLARFCARTLRKFNSGDLEKRFQAHLQAFNLEASPREMFTLALECANTDPEGTIKHLHQFGLQDPAQRLHLFKLCIKFGHYKTAIESFPLLALNPGPGLVEMIKQCMTDSPIQTFTALKRMTLAIPEDDLFELALIAIQGGYPISVTRHLSLLNITSEEKRAALARLCFAANSEYKDSYFSSRNEHSPVEMLPHFHIYDPKLLRELFPIALRRWPQHAIQMLSSFQLEIGEELLAYLMGILSPRTASAIMQNINTLPLNKEARRTLTFACVKWAPSMVTQMIEKLDLDEEDRIAIAHELIDRGEESLLLSQIKAFHLSDEKVRRNLAKRFAEKATDSFLCNIPDFDLNVEGRFEIAMLLAAQGGAIAVSLAQYFDQFKIESIESIETIALQAAKAGPTELFTDYFHRFGLKNAPLLEEIFELLLLHLGAKVLKSIHCFHKPFHRIPRNRAIKLARMSENSAMSVATNVTKFDFGLDDRESLFELAAICVEQGPTAAAGMFKNLGPFGFDGSQKWEQLLVKAVSTGNEAASALLEVIRLPKLSQECRKALFEKCYQYFPEQAVKKFKPFLSEDPDFTSKITPVKTLSEKENEGKFIESINQLLPEERLSCIFNVLTQHDGERILKWLERIDLDAQQRLLLALEMPERFLKDLVQHFPKFDLRLSEDRLQVAIKLAERAPLYIAEHFSSFALTSTAHRSLVAEACCRSQCQNAHLRQSFRFFRNFMIETENERIRLAELAANAQPLTLMQHLKAFEITKKAALLQIAAIALKNEPECPLEPLFDLFAGEEALLYPLLAQSKRVSSVIWRVGLSDSDLHNHLLRCAHTEPKCLAENIAFYAIDDPELLYKMAIEVIKNGPKRIPLMSFMLLDEEKRFHLALLMIQLGKLQFKRHNQLLMFRITSSDKQSILARQLIEKEGASVIPFVKQHFVIQKEEDLYEMLLSAARVSPVELATGFASYRVSHEGRRLAVFLTCVRHDEESLMHIAQFGFTSPLMKPLSEAIDQLKIHPETVNPAVYAAAREFVSIAYPQEAHQEILELIRTAEAMPSHFQHSAIKWLLHSLLVLSHEKDPAAAKWAAHQEGPWLKLLALRSPPLRAKLTSGLNALSSKREDSPLWALCSHSRLPLLSLALAQLEEAGVRQDHLLAIAQDLIQRPKNKDSKFRDTFVIQRLLMILNTIAMHNSSSEAKEQLLLSLFRKDSMAEDNEAKMLERMDALQGLFDLGRISDLIEKPAANPTHLFETAFQDILPVADIPLLATKYQKTFGSCRKPDALPIYASRIRSLCDVPVMDTLVHYVTGVLNDTFTEDRYSIEENLHLRTVFAWRQDLKPLWREGYKRPLSHFAVKEEKSASFNTTVWLKDILLHNHLTKPLSYLERYLNAEDPTVLEDITQFMQKIPIPQRRELFYKQLKLQQLCILLTKASQQELINGGLIQQLISLVEKTPSMGEEFINDLKGLKLTLSGGQKQAGELNVILSDDYVDLLLCGHEVAGSCQRLDGTASTNRALLAYLNDGKNKLIAIKDQRGRIHARAILRLLWQEDRPALFLERSYPARAPEYALAIKEAAKEIAAKLRLSLYQTEAEKAGDRPKQLKALGGPAKHEYVDAIKGACINGIFSHPGYPVLSS